MIDMHNEIHRQIGFISGISSMKSISPMPNWLEVISWKRDATAEVSLMETSQKATELLQFIYFNVTYSIRKLLQLQMTHIWMFAGI